MYKAEALDLKPEISDKNEALRLDLLTQFSELVDGSMRTSFELIFDGRDLVGEDGRSMGDVTEAALAEGKKLAHSSPNLAFEYRRRLHERQEYLELIEMAKGNGSNTMVVVSDFPAELIDSKSDVGGYNVTRKQTMLRVLTREPDGNILMESQSLDMSDREALESIYDYFGLVADAGELLGQRIHADLGAELQANLTDRLTGIYDRSLADHYGGEWYAGKQPIDKRNTYDFVVGQHDLVDLAIDLDRSGQLDTAGLYNIAATMQARFAREKAGVASIIPYLPDVNREVLLRELNYEGDLARNQGISFSACGQTLNSEGGLFTLSEALTDSGYGNKTSTETSYGFDKKMHCVVCQPNPKENEPKKMCGPCGICRQCDNKLTK